MSSSARFLAVILLMLWCVPVALYAQTAAKQPAGIPRGSVSGRVTIKDKPVPGVVIGLRLTVSGVPSDKTFRGVTDQEGFYHITGVPPGTYDITPAAGAYVVDSTNTARMKNVIVNEDEEVEDINFSLVRGGVITGKITDGDGRPLIQESVSLYRASDFQDQQPRQVYPAGNVTTDDRGIYRFYALAPGRYKVGCGKGQEPVVTFSSSRIIYKQVFFPDVTDHAKAKIIEVREGSEATNVDISLGAPIQTFSVSGRVVDAEKNVPMPNLRFVFQRAGSERFEMGGASAISNINGEFVAEGLMPGKYAAVLFGSGQLEARVETSWFDVIDQDVTGLTIRMLKGLTVSGVVALEPDDKKAFAKLTELQLRGYITPASGSPSVGTSTGAPIAPDGTFQLKGLSPGNVSLWLTGPNAAAPPKGFTIVRTEQNGVPLLHGIELKEGDQITGVRIVVSYGTASVRGTVNIVNGTLPPGTRMFARLTKPTTTPPQQIATAMVDARGQFLLEGVPAGVYEVSVSTFTPNSKTPVSAKREVNVMNGIVNEVSVTLDLTPLQKP
jgi:protocatechuate 3,4-dioxygenase beta subunit